MPFVCDSGMRRINRKVRSLPFRPENNSPFPEHYNAYTPTLCCNIEVIIPYPKINVKVLYRISLAAYLDRERILSILQERSFVHDSLFE